MTDQQKQTSEVRAADKSRADALTGGQRQRLGEALSEYFGKLDSDEGIRAPEGRILRAFDYCDSRNIDDLIDRAIVPALAAPVEQHEAAPAAPRTEMVGAVPKGWKLVPVEMTPGMRGAYVDHAQARTGADSAWNAMLDAAPTPPADAAAAPADEQDPLGWKIEGGMTCTVEAAAERGKTYQARAYAAASGALARIHEICLRYGCGNEVMHDWLERTLRAAASQPAADDISCVACEGSPSPNNSPCAICNRSAPATPATLASDQSGDATEMVATTALTDAAIAACALMIKGICMTRPRERWASEIEGRIRCLLNRANQEEPRAEVMEEQPSLTNPLTPYGMLVRALRIVTGTLLGDMAKSLQMSSAKLSAMEFGRESVTPEIVREVGTYFESLGIHNMRPALQFAIDATRTGAAS